MSDITPEIPKKGKRKPPDPYKLFIEKCKLYFTSFNARQTPWAYFNLIPGKIFLSNSTSPTPNKLHGDRLMNHLISELGVHILTIKDLEFLKQVRVHFQIPETGDYLVHVPRLISALASKKSLVKNEHGVLFNKDDNMVLGSYIQDSHISQVLRNILQIHQDVGSEQHRSSTPHHAMPIPEDIVRIGKLSMITLNTNIFDRDTSIFHDTRQTIRIPIIDGISTVDYREFLKKLEGKHTFTHELYLWVKEHAAISMISIYDDVVANIMSIRPNLIIFPMPNTLSVKDTDYANAYNL